MYYKVFYVKEDWVVCAVMVKVLNYSLQACEFELKSH